MNTNQGITIATTTFVTRPKIKKNKKKLLFCFMRPETVRERKQGRDRERKKRGVESAKSFSFAVPPAVFLLQIFKGQRAAEEATYICSATHQGGLQLVTSARLSPSRRSRLITIRNQIRQHITRTKGADGRTPDPSSSFPYFRTKKTTDFASDLTSMTPFSMSDLPCPYVDSARKQRRA